MTGVNKKLFAYYNHSGQEFRISTLLGKSLQQLIAGYNHTILPVLVAIVYLYIFFSLETIINPEYKAVGKK